MKRTVTAIEREGFDIRTISLLFDVPDEKFDIEGAVRKAVNDFCRTEKGRAALAYTEGSFDWADFDVFVSNKFCKKYGFQKIETDLPDIEVWWYEQLYEEDSE